MKLNWGDRAAQLVSERIAAPETSTTTIKAIPADRRVDGMVCVDLGTSALWVFDADSAANASDTVLVPTAGTGRWLSASSGALADSKVSVRAATTANLVATRTGNVLLADANGALGAQDGVTMVVGDRILVKNQTATEDNGIYYITALGGGAAKHSFTRAPDADTSAKVTAGLAVYVSEGTVAGNHHYVLTTDDAIVLNTTGLTFAKQPILADFSSTANGLGAALVGIEDTATKFDATTVEGAFNELTLTTAGNGANIIGLEDSAGIITATTVEGAIAENRPLIDRNPAKIRVRAATAGALAAYTRTANVITADAVGALGAIDGVAVAQGERILLVNGAAGADNGVYDITTLGDGGTAYVLTRSSDCNTSAKVLPGLTVFVSEGTANGNEVWTLTTDDAITLNTTALTFAQVHVSRTDLASTANALGASLIGIEDSATIYAATNVETALAEVKALVDAGLTLTKRTVTIGHADLVGAVNGASAAINLGAVLPANARIMGASIHTVTPFSGGGATALAFDIGTAGDVDAIVDGADLFAAAVDGQANTLPAGISPNKLFAGAGAQLIVTATPDGAHTLDGLDAGSAIVDVLYTVVA